MSISLGILGTGMAAEIHSRTLKAVAPSVRRFYASRDRDRAAAIVAKFGGTGHFGGYDEMLASRDIDVVLICLPPSLHKKWALRSLAAGKHVIVEKPPFLTTGEFDEAAEAAARAGRQVLVAENYFYKPLTTFLKRSISAGELGDVLLLQVNALKRQQTANWRDDVAVAGGGALFEGGIHWVSLLANIGLTPERIRAARLRSPGAGASFGEAGGAGRAGGEDRAGSTWDPASAGLQAGTERTAVVTLEYAEGAVATLSYSWDLPSLVNGVRMSRIYGTGGTLRFETNGIFAAQTGRRPRLTLPGLADLAGYRAMMVDFVSAINDSRPPLYNQGLARRDLQLVEQAYASIPVSQHS